MSEDIVNDVLPFKARRRERTATCPWIGLLDSTPSVRANSDGVAMASLNVWCARLACAVASTACADGAAADVETRVYRDGFEPREPAELVLDAVNRSSAIRRSATESWDSTLQLPDSLGALGLADPFPAGPALATLQSGVLALNFNGDLAGESLAFAPWLQADALRWVCGNAPPPLDATLLSGSTSASNTSLPDAVLPDACRSEPSPTALVLEAWGATFPAQLEVAEHWISVAPPASLSEVGLDDPLPVARARLTLDDGLLVATFVAPLADHTLAIAPWLQGGAWRWVCGHAPPPVDAILQSGTSAATQTTLPEAILPEACRSDPSEATQVRDVFFGMTPARLAIAESWASEGALPATLTEAGLQDPLPVALARLQLDDGVLVATFVGDLDGKRLGMAPWNRDGTLHWVCGHAVPPPDAVALASSSASSETTLDTAFLPEGCR